MTLQKMRYRGDGEKKTVICAVDTVSRGAEFTICGNNCLHACVSERDDWDIIGDNFAGKLKRVTCPKCRRIIDFIKSFE